MSVWFESDKQLGECCDFTVAVHYALMVKVHATFILSFIKIQQKRKKCNLKKNLQNQKQSLAHYLEKQLPYSQTSFGVCSNSCTVIFHIH